MELFEYLAKWCIGNNTYSISEIFNQRSDMLTISIEQNVPHVLKYERLPNGKMEERQACILSMIQDVCSRYTIHDLVFCYDTRDRVFSPSSPCFTHARLNNTLTRNILAPCFTFKQYQEGPNLTPKSWIKSYTELLTNTTTWADKENICAFVGSLTNENHRIHNTDISLPIPLQINDQPASSSSFIPRYELSKYKYLLHLNGHQGAYASRLKYLLGTGSLVFYNYNSGCEMNYWEEWWMNPTLFSNNTHFISCSSKGDFKTKLEYYMNNQNEASIIANTGYTFFKDFLTYDNVLLFWSHLLNEYASRLQ